MKILLVRHGVAEERGGATPDEDRALTRDGRRKTRKAMRGLARVLGDARPLVLSSPLVRAWETAKIFAKVLEADPPRVERGLSPAGERAHLLERLGHERREWVALVGHEPDLSELAKHLGGGSLEIRKAGAALLDGEPREAGAHLVWLLPPLLLRRLSR